MDQTCSTPATRSIAAQLRKTQRLMEHMDTFRTREVEAVSKGGGCTVRPIQGLRSERRRHSRLQVRFSISARENNVPREGTRAVRRIPSHVDTPPTPAACGATPRTMPSSKQTDVEEREVEDLPDISPPVDRGHWGGHTHRTSSERSW